jgi:CRISPR-associated protein Cas2
MEKLIISYDISNDKLRTRFSKFLSKFGGRLQYSVFEIRNSERVLENIVTQITGYFEKHFTQGDSIIIFHLSRTCKKTCFGYAKNDETDLIIV